MRAGGPPSLDALIIRGLLVVPLLFAATALHLLVELLVGMPGMALSRAADRIDGGGR